MNKSLLIRLIAIGIALGVMVMPQTTHADLESQHAKVVPSTLVYNGHLTICKIDKSSYQVVKTIKMVITAYSSTEDQTDDTPFITASNKRVRDGIIANNLLAFGTKVRFPELYGDKVFTVEDRMHPRKGKNHADIWFPEYEQAKNFGYKISSIQVLEN